MAQTRLYLKKDLNRDGRAAVLLSIYVNNARMRLGTGVTVRPEDWNELKQEVKRTDANYAALNGMLKARTIEVESAVLNGIAAHGDTFSLRLLTEELSRRRVEPVANKVVAKVESFWDYYDQFLRVKQHELEPRTIAKYRTLRVILQEVETRKSQLNFEGIDHNFYDRLKNHMMKQRKLTNNTMGKYVSCFKTFLSWAVDRGATVNPAYRKFKVDAEEVEVVALTWDELMLLADVDLSANPRLDRVRDLFLLECYTGARFGDIQAMNYDDIREGVWHLRQQKTKTEVRIHLSKRAEAIVNKYRSAGNPLPVLSSQKMNEYLKELGQKAGLNAPFRQVRRSGKATIERRGPKWQFLSSHVARKTFVSISLERGMRHEVVMSFTGHKDFKTMKKYIALTEKSRKEDVERVWG